MKKNILYGTQCWLLDCLGGAIGLCAVQIRGSVHRMYI